MADFSTPFGENGERRLPTGTEQSLGFPCGPADKALFTGLHHVLQSEVGEVISFAGLTPDDEDNTQLRQAIELLIAAATGAGDTSQFLLVSQARARLPIFPEINSADGKINVFSPASGTIRVPGGVGFQHRGIFPVTTVETDFATDPSKIYHVRWNPTDGFAMEDLASGTYNPGALAETDAAFDSTYDDMLVSRVVTNASNIPTITNLANKVRLARTDFLLGTPVTFNGANGATFAFSNSHNWARRPDTYHVSNIGSEMTNGRDDHDHNIREANIPTTQFEGNLSTGGPGKLSTVDMGRYSFGATLLRDGATSASLMVSMSG